jgi:hypothetical protein
MPGITPSTATPTKQAIDNQNSQRWMRKMRRRSLNSNRPGRGDHDRCERAAREVAKQIGCQQQEQRHGHCADYARELRLRARGFCYRGARGAAADRKPLEESGRQVGGAETHHLLIRIDLRACAGRICARQNAGVRERHHCHGAAADHHLAEIGQADPRHRERWQTLRQRTEHLHSRGVLESERTHHERRAHHRDQDARNSLERLER